MCLQRFITMGERINRNEDWLDDGITRGRPGIYFKILQEGEVEAGDSIDLISKDENNITVKDIVQLYVKDTKDIESMRRAIRVKDLSVGWRYHFRQQIGQLTK
jgi:MOSC domain-containing protein YiiM